MSDPNALAAPAAPAAPAAAPAASPAAAPVAPPAAPAWLPADVAPEILGHAQNAGWQGPADAVKSHFELQKLFGADRHGRTVVVPKDDAPAEEWGKFHERLGRPPTAADYKLPVPEGGDPKFSEAVSGKFHELGIPLKAGQALANWWNETAKAAAEADAAQQMAALQAEHQALAKDWGTEQPLRTELARRAAMTLGLNEQQVQALEKTVGFSGVMKAFAKVGDLLRESGAEGLTELGTFGKTPEGAKAKKAQLMADADWRKRAMVPNSKEWAELQSLDKIIVGA